MKYSVTGIVELEREHEPIINEIIIELDDITEFHTGGAFGVDTYAALMAQASWPNPHATHHLWLPSGKWFNRQLINTHNWDSVNYVKGGYRARNKSLVDNCDILLAFPKTEKELFRGSGTWMTIRIAREQGKEVRIFPLEK